MALDVDRLLGSIEIWRGGGHSLSELFIAAGVNDVSDDQLLAAVRDRLLNDADLVENWQGYSYDKRWVSPMKWCRSAAAVSVPEM